MSCNCGCCSSTSTAACAGHRRLLQGCLAAVAAVLRRRLPPAKWWESLTCCCEQQNTRRRYLAHKFLEPVWNVALLTGCSWIYLFVYTFPCVFVLNLETQDKKNTGYCRPMWVRGHCRISPPRFLAECRKRRLNQGSFVLLYFRLPTLFDLYLVFVCLFSCIVFLFSFCMFIFLYCFVCQYQSSHWLWRPPPKWSMLCRWGVKLYSLTHPRIL